MVKSALVGVRILWQGHIHVFLLILFVCGISFVLYRYFIPESIELKDYAKFHQDNVNDYPDPVNDRPDPASFPPDTLSQPNPPAAHYATSCFSFEPLFFHDLISFLKKSKIPLIKTETVDLLDASNASFTRRLLTTNLVRLGVFGEDVLALERFVHELETAATLSTAFGTFCAGKPKPALKIMKNYENNQLVNVFFILRKAGKNNAALGKFLKKKGLPYFSWRRLHLRIFYQRGHESRIFSKGCILYSERNESRLYREGPQRGIG